MTLSEQGVADYETLLETGKCLLEVLVLQIEHAHHKTHVAVLNRQIAIASGYYLRILSVAKLALLYVCTLVKQTA